MLKLIKYQNAHAKSLTQKYEGLNPREDHNQLLDRYIQSLQMKNFTEETIGRQKRFLKEWFDQHGNEFRPLFTWEAMEPVIGRKRILN